MPRMLVNALCHGEEIHTRTEIKANDLQEVAVEKGQSQGTFAQEHVLVAKGKHWLSLMVLELLLIS